MDYHKLLVLHINNYFSDDMKELGIKVRWIYRKDHCSTRKWRILKFLGLERFLLGFSKTDVLKAEYILLCSHMYMSDIVKIISLWNPSCKIVWFLWDAADNNVLDYIEEMRDMKNLLIYSYDREDCDRYNLCWHNSAVKKYPVTNTGLKEQWDFGCIMMDKGRMPILEKLQEYFERQGYSYKFIIKKEKHKKYDLYHNIEFIDKDMPYSQLINYDVSFKCIIDILFKKNTGLSLRAYESIFYDKKLLTNNPDIKNFDFYHPNNIFVFTENNLDEIAEFMTKQYLPVPESIQKRYRYEQWLDDLFKGAFE